MASALADVPGIPRAGDTIAGKYKVEEVIGQGGMGVVVRANHLALGQWVAIKFLLPAAAALPGAVERFLREARSAVAIQSEHVARVLDVATTEAGMPYMVLEHLVGTDLRRMLMTRGTLAVSEAVDYILQAGEAIAEAHALGIIHRDLKPANIFVTSRLDGSPFIKVLDFGLSTAHASDLLGIEEATLTTTEAVMGSPPYMSPEQIRSLKNVDARSDIWSLGVILYRLLAGRRPFVGDTLPAVVASITADTPEPLTSIRPEIPRALAAMVDRCLAKEVAERVQTMAELAQAIAPFGSAEAQVSLSRILKATRGTTEISANSSGGTLAASALASVSHSLDVHDPSTGHVSAWSQPRAPSKRSSKSSVVALGCALAAIVAVALAAARWTNAPAVVPADDARATAAPGGAAATGTAAVDALAAPSSTAASATSSAFIPPLSDKSSAAPSAASSAAHALPDPRAGSTGGPVRAKVEPKPAVNSSPVDPLERWK